MREVIDLLIVRFIVLGGRQRIAGLPWEQNFPLHEGLAILL